MNNLQELKHLNILFADDDDSFRESTCKILEMLFNIVYSAKSGDEALDIYNKNSINIVMLDIRMGMTSGIKAAQTIRKSNSKIPIFLVSSYTQTDELLEACTLNIVNYLIKPFTFQKLSESLLKCVERLHEEKLLLVPISNHISYDPSKKVLFINGEVNILSNSEILTLELLLESRGYVVNYDRFLHILGEDISQAGLKNIILKLRKRVGDTTIRNLSKVGYTLV